MSAIAGIINLNPDDGLERAVNRMCDIQMHRGPHGKGVESLTGACLGHQLLLLDPDRDTWPRGPISMAEGKAAIVFDGVLFNKTGLVKELDGGERAGVREPDGKTVLRSYLRWGKESVRHLDGIFSFAIWDWKNMELYAAVDRLGEKSFFYHLNSNGEFIFASEIKALLKSGRISRQLDYEAIYHYLHEKGFISPRTPLSRVRSLPPGHRLLWRDGTINILQYWDIPYISEKIADTDYALSTSAELLRRSVEKRISGPTVPGILYSGGVDSSLLLWVLDSVTEKQSKTFTIVTGLREEQLQLSRKAALQLKTDHTEIHITPKKLADGLTEYVWFLSTPTVGSIMAYFCAREAQKRGATTLLTGNGADSALQAPWLYRYLIPMEKLLTPLKLIPEKIRVGIYDFSERALRGAFERPTEERNKYITLLYLYFRDKRGLSHLYDARIYPDRLISLFSPEISQEGWMHPADVYRDLFKKFPSSQIDERSVYTLLKSFIYFASSNHESITAAHSIQMHNPFIDYRLIEFSQRIPYSIRGTGGSGKYILRELCRRFLSSEFAEQKKAAFDLPLGRWLQHELRPIIEETLSRESVERRGIFDHKKIEELTGQFMSGASDIAFSDIWAFIILEIWLRTHCDPLPEELSKPSGDWLKELVG